MTGPILSAQMRLSEVSDWLSRLGGALEGLRYGVACDSWTDSKAYASLHIHFPSRSHAVRFAEKWLSFGKDTFERETINQTTMYITELPSFRVTLFYPTP